jgi:hypothetical protein
MFRALLCPSSGASFNCPCSLWLPYDCRVGRVSNCDRFTDHSLKHVQPCNHTVTRGCMGSWRRLLMMGTITDHSLKHMEPGNHTVTRGCMGSWRRLLMMGTTVPETCWAVYTRQSNKNIYIDCVSGWLFYSINVNYLHIFNYYAIETDLNKRL